MVLLGMRGVALSSGNLHRGWPEKNMYSIITLEFFRGKSVVQVCSVWSLEVLIF